MSDNKNDILSNLTKLGFSEAEATIYYELTRRGPLTHLQLSRVTNISRTKVYRLVEKLVQNGVVVLKTDDEGTAIMTNNHETLELALIADAEKLASRQQALKQVRPMLDELGVQGRPPLNFSFRTYDGITGFKQMLWNELKTKGELLAFGDGTLEDLVSSHAWAEKQRALTIERGYTIREIANKPVVPTPNRAFIDSIQTRHVSVEILPLQHQIIIYNETVSVYCWRDGQKTGIEIINASYAQTMRAMFEHYWELTATQVLTKVY